MNAIAAVCAKEIVDNLRDRRTMFSTLAFGPLFAPLLFAIMLHFIIDRTVSSAETRLKVPMVGIERAANLGEFLSARGIDAEFGRGITDLDTAAAAVERGAAGLVIVVEDTFADDFGGSRPARITVVFDRANQRDGERVQRVQQALKAYSDRIASLRLVARGVSPSIMQPVIVDGYDVSTPTSRSALMLGILTYFLLFATWMGGIYLAIDTTAGERERRSLEPLLTTPAPRSSLLLGKIAATAAFMLASLALTLLGFVVVLRLLPLDALEMSSGFTAATAAKAFGLLAPFALLGAVIMTLVASFTRSYKEAQTYLGLLLIVPTLPVAAATVLNVRPTQALMWVPSMSQHLLMTDFIKHAAVSGLMVTQSVVSTLIYTALLSLAAIGLYKREAILG